MKQFFDDTLDMFCDSGLVRTFFALAALLSVLALLLVTASMTLFTGVFGEVDWSTAAWLWSWPAFSWIPVVPSVAAVAMAVWGRADEGLWFRLADIVLTAFVLAGGTTLIQAASVVMNQAARVDPTAGMPLPGNLILWVGIAAAIGHIVHITWRICLSRQPRGSR